MRFQDWRGEIECTQIQKGKNNYNVDGIIFDKDKDLELLLLESSGPLGTRDRHRHVFDHIKSAYGCYSMLVHILDKYPDADKSLIDVAKVLFVHSSARDNDTVEPHFLHSRFLHTPAFCTPLGLNPTCAKSGV